MADPRWTAGAIIIGATCLLALSAYRLSVWIDHRRQRDQQATLDTVVGEERRLSLVLDDPTDEPLEVDPPVTRRFTDADLDAWLAQRARERRTGHGV